MEINIKAKSIILFQHTLLSSAERRIINMKVKSSEYLNDTKPVLKKLLGQLLKEYPYASILAVDSTSANYTVNKNTTNMGEDELWCIRGFVVKVYDGQSYGEYSFNEISEEKLEDIIISVRSTMKNLKKAITDLNLCQYQILEDEPCVLCESTDYMISPEDLGDEEILNRLTQIKDECLAFDEKVINAIAMFEYRIYHKLFLSKNRDLEQNVMYATGGLVVVTKKGQELKTAMKGYSNLGGAEILDKLQKGIQETGKTALDLLSSEPITPGEYDCICSPEVTGMIAHEAFGHGVEMDMFVKDRALAKSYVGKYVASPILNMHDGASLNAQNEVATYFFDDDGVLSKDTIIIKNGILQSGISDAQSAMALGTVPTGNGRRESYKRKAYTRMTNTYFEPGKDKLKDMIASIDYGFYLENPSSGMEDPKNWGIQLMVSVAREIKDGKFTGKIFSPIVMSGYVPDLLKSITMMSDESELCGVGMCGKGYKEWVIVSDGGPYIKARIRLG